MKKFASFLLLLSLGCTCLVGSTFASFFGEENPCHHHIEAANDKKEDPKKHCCDEKQTAWKEVTEMEEEAAFVVPPVGFTAFIFDFDIAFYYNSHNFVALKTKKPPNETLGWKTIRLIL